MGTIKKKWDEGISRFLLHTYKRVFFFFFFFFGRVLSPLFFLFLFMDDIMDGCYIVLAKAIFLCNKDIGSLCDRKGRGGVCVQVGK